MAPGNGTGNIISSQPAKVDIKDEPPPPPPKPTPHAADLWVGCSTARLCTWCSRPIRRLLGARTLQAGGGAGVDRREWHRGRGARDFRHPLLQAAAVNAARSSKFTPTKLSANR